MRRCKRWWPGLVILIALNSVGLSAENPSLPNPATPTSQSESDKKPDVGALELVPQVSMIMPSRFVLSTDRYIIPYSKDLEGLALFSLGAATPIVFWGPIQVEVQAGVGFAHKEGVMALHNQAGVNFNDDISLNWIPFSTSLKISYEIPGIHFMKPALSLGGGVNWLHQSGTLDGVDHAYWLPFWVATPCLTFLAGHHDDWFGGFTFGVSYQDTFGSAQSLRAVSFDLSLNIWL
jgi:hypothetical protein